MIKTKCPRCGHIIIIPKSVKQYTCVCGKEFKITIIKNEPAPTTPEQSGTTEG